MDDTNGILRLSVDFFGSNPSFGSSFVNKSSLQDVLLNSVLAFTYIDTSDISDKSQVSVFHVLSTLPHAYQNESTTAFRRTYIQWDILQDDLELIKQNMGHYQYAFVFACPYSADFSSLLDLSAISSSRFTFGDGLLTIDYNGSTSFYGVNLSRTGVYPGGYVWTQYAHSDLVPYIGEVVDTSLDSSPFVVPASGTVPSLPISALPYRAYESIYNAFYRDIRNNPYDPNGNGQYEYNRYIPTQDGGADTNTYELHRRNWEQDFLTTAVQSPQQGVAPLVGVTGDGTFRFQDDDGKVYTAKATVTEDGNTVTGFSLESSDMPTGNLRLLMDLASSGISINDFRNVNALQRWLETNMRKGLRYRDQIQAHYGVTVRYDELDMPEFIGGTSVPIMVNQVTQTTPTDGSPLGMYGGQATCMGSGRSVTKYFDEHGYIMAIFSVTPVPNYSQLLPKMFIKTNPLDYYFPEFGHIGYQPIFYNEVCPLQAFNAGGSEELKKVFGYQRAWYEYLQSTDEVHGDFRLSLRDFLINRVFSSAPELSEEFLLVDPAQVNDVFAVTNEDAGDKILGQIYFKIQAKRPIPMLGIPRIDG